LILFIRVITIAFIEYLSVTAVIDFCGYWIA